MTEAADSGAEAPTKQYQLLQRASLFLSEHFDSVQIVVTERMEHGATALHHYGVGNWYARESSMREWLKVQDARTREEAIHPADE